MASRDNAKRVLVHYFMLIGKRAGVEWHSDLTTEIEGIVDDICDAAVAEAVADAQADAESRYGSGEWRNAR